MDRSPPRRILLIRLSALGDVVSVLPVLPAIRATYPQAHISFLTGPLTAPLLEADPCIDAVIIHRRSHNPLKRLACMCEVHAGHFDLVIDFHSARYTRWLALASAAPRRVGARGGVFYTDVVTHPSGAISPVARAAAMLKAISIDASPIPIRFPARYAAQEATTQLLRCHSLEPGQFVVMHPGHSPQWTTKRWPIAYWADIAKRTQALGLKCALTGNEEDKDQVRAICDLTPCIDICGQTPLAILAGVLGHARALLCTDSGPLHIAAQVGCPVTALFGPTDPQRNAPAGDGVRILHHEIFCSRCFRKRCPYNHACLDGLTPDEAWTELSAQINVQ